MSTYKWRPEEEHLLKLLLPTHTQKAIAEELTRRYNLGLSGFPTERTEESVRKKIARENLQKEATEDYKEENEYKQTWKQLERLQSEYKENSVKTFPGVMPADQAMTKILCLSDIHFPFARTDLLEMAVTEHADADICVLNGDIFEGYVFSVFEKSQRIAAIHEYMAVFEFVHRCKQIFPKVVLVDGNHDVRSSRLLKKSGLPKEATELLRPNLMARIANGERIDETGMLVEKLDFSNVYYTPQESWYVKVGKTLFIHPSTRGGSKPGWTVTTMGQKLMSRYPDDEVDSVVCGHTHQVYKGIVDGKLLIEQGCLADLLAYHWAPNNIMKKNYQNGFAIIYQDEDGNTDFNRSGPVYLGEVFPPKKGVFDEE